MFMDSVTQMANLDATMPGPAASPLIGHRPNPWFNVLAGVIVVTGIIYAGVPLGG